MEAGAAQWSVEGHYGRTHGWEVLCTEDTHEEAMQRLAEYDLNEPGYRHRVRRVRPEGTEREGTR